MLAMEAAVQRAVAVRPTAVLIRALRIDIHRRDREDRTDMAAANRGIDAASSSPDPQAAEGRAAFGAVRTLRILLVGSIVLPLLLGSVAGFLSYRADYRRAVSALAEAAAVAEENTAKILVTHVLVAARIDDLLAGLSDAEIRDREKALHERMARQIETLPQVAAAWVIHRLASPAPWWPTGGWRPIRYTSRSGGRRVPSCASGSNRRSATP